MAQRIVKISTSEMTRKLFGSFDANAKEIETAFSVKLRNREAENGDAVLIDGEQENVDLAAEVIEYLLGVAKINETIEGQTLRYAIDMVKTGQGAALSGFDEDCICITHRSKPIKAKTVGQKQYVEAIRKNTVVFGVRQKHHHSRRRSCGYG